MELPLIFPSSWHEFSALSETWDDEFEKGPKQLKKDEMKAINKWGVTWKWSEDFVCASVQSWNDLTWSYLYFIVSPYHFFCVCNHIIRCNSKKVRKIRYCVFLYRRYDNCFLQRRKTRYCVVFLELIFISKVIRLFWWLFGFIVIRFI